MKGARKKKRRPYRYRLLLVSLVVALFLGELSLRLYGHITNTDFRLYQREIRNPDRLPAGLVVHDEDMVQRLNPNVQVMATTADFNVLYRINSKGLRDREYDYGKDPDTLRILAFGSSFTFGEGIPYGKRFTDIPEDELEDVEIINFGVPGFGLDQSLIYYATEGTKYEADYVFLFLTAAYVERNFTGDGWKGVKERTVPIGVIYLERNDPFLKELEPRSYLLSYLGYHIQLWFLMKRFEQHDEERWSRLSQANYTRVWDDEAKQRVVTLIGEFERMAAENNMSVVLIGIDSSRKLSYLRESSIPFYDLGEGLLGLKEEQPLSFKYDPHYNEGTNRFIGMEVKKIVQELRQQSDAEKAGHS